MHQALSGNAAGGLAYDPDANIELDSIRGATLKALEAACDDSRALVERIILKISESRVQVAPPDSGQTPSEMLDTRLGAAVAPRDTRYHGKKVEKRHRHDKILRQTADDASPTYRALDSRARERRRRTSYLEREQLSDGNARLAIDKMRTLQGSFSSKDAALIDSTGHNTDECAHKIPGCASCAKIESIEDRSAAESRVAPVLGPAKKLNSNMPTEGLSSYVCLACREGFTQEDESGYGV
eukprot:UC1_evm1s1957